MIAELMGGDELKEGSISPITMKIIGDQGGYKGVYNIEVQIKRAVMNLKNVNFRGVDGKLNKIVQNEWIWSLCSEQIYEMMTKDYLLHTVDKLCQDYD